jgi:GAF domain-containing protein
VVALGGPAIPESLCVLAHDLCGEFEQRVVGAHCSVLVADHAPQRLLHVAAPTLPIGFQNVIDGLPIAEGVGACGTAGARHERVVVEDVMHDPLTRGFVGVASTFGLRSIWSEPLLKPNGVLCGTFAVYRTEPHRPGEAELAAMQEMVRRLVASVSELYPAAAEVS